MGSYLKVQSIMAEKAWWQEHEAAGHIASTVRKQREMDAGAQLTVSLQDPSLWDGATHICGTSSPPLLDALWRLP